MRWSATKLRWLLLGGVLLLTAVVGGFLGLARYRAARLWQHILARNGVNLRQETNGITWSQSSGGRTVFTLHASKAIPEGKHRWALHDAVLVLYGREPGRDDRIYGRNFEYDDTEGVARALGEVNLDLQTPGPANAAHQQGPEAPLGFGTTQESAAPGSRVIHVRTSGLVYTRKLGLATTKESTEFRFGDLVCTSLGAEFDSVQSRVRLLAAVHLQGTLRNRPFSLQAAHAELDRKTEVASLVAPVLRDERRTASAAEAVLHLNKDGSLQTLEAGGGVSLGSGTTTMTAPTVQAAFAAANRPVRAHLASGVSLVGTDPLRPVRAHARSLDLAWDGSGVLSRVNAQEDVSFEQTSTAFGGKTQQRRFTAKEAIGSLAGSKGRSPELQKVQLIGSARIASKEQKGPGVGAAEDTQIAADQLTANFGQGSGRQPALQRLTGVGHTTVEQVRSDGSRQQSAGDTLEATFAPAVNGQRPPMAKAAGERGPGQPRAGQEQLISAVQTGHVRVQSWTAGTPTHPAEHTLGDGASASDAASNSTLTLAGGGGEHATVSASAGDLEAEEIVLHQDTGDADAQGGVLATSVGQAGGEATHVQASRAHLAHTTGLTRFFGEPGRPVRLWQGGSEIQADTLLLDGRTHVLEARPTSPEGLVRAVFVEAEKGEGPTVRVQPRHRTGEVMAGPGQGALRVSAGKLDFNQLRGEALFTGRVQAEGSWGQAAAAQGTVFLHAANHAGPPSAVPGGLLSQSAGMMGAALDHIVLLGDVQLRQPGRLGTGQQLTYAAATGDLLLTGSPGHPPRVVGERGAVISGPTLLFHGADSTIVVTGAKSDTRDAKPARVHTEVDLK